MSLRLIKPGVGSANLAGKIHPKTGELIEPLGVLPSGKVVWPVMGASPDDPDDPEFTGEDDDEDEEDDEEEEDSKPSKKSSSKKSKKPKDDDEDDEDEDEDDEDKRPRAVRQAARYRTRLRAEERKNAELTQRITALENKDKDPDEVVSQELTTTRARVTALEETNRIQSAMLAFFKTPVRGVTWADPSDVFTVAEREGLFDDVIDEDGNVDVAELRRGLRDLAKRKKHLVKAEDAPKARGRKSTDDDEDDDEEEDEEPRSRRSASPMNGARKGKRQTGPTRDSLAKKFPVLNRI